MSQHIKALEESGLITDCTGSWGSLLLLAAKYHQDNCTDISNFVWRLYVSYRPLNSITYGFGFFIPRCDDNIKDIGYSCGNLFIISFDARSGYHHIRGRQYDQENLTFFTPSGGNITYKVMSIGPNNTPAFYTDMMQILRED